MLSRVMWVFQWCFSYIIVCQSIGSFFSGLSVIITGRKQTVMAEKSRETSITIDDDDGMWHSWMFKCPYISSYICSVFR